jgi:enterochelin esterase-like enzyme
MERGALPVPLEAVVVLLTRSVRASVKGSAPVAKKDSRSSFKFGGRAMKKLFGVLIAIALTVGCTSVPKVTSARSGKGEVKLYQIQSKIPGSTDKRALSVYLPEDYDTSRASYPVLYLIHGSGGNNLTLLGSGYGAEGWMSDANVSVIVDRLIGEGRIKPLIVVCPDVSTADQEYVACDLVPFVDRTFRSVPKRGSRAIAGHCTGGFDSLLATLAHPEIFSLAGGFSSAGTELLTFRSGELLKAHNQKSLPLRFWLYAGTNDQFGLAPSNRDFVKVLRENGLPTEYIEDDGDHYGMAAKRLGEFIEYSSGFFE